jgi:hypothetical protein
MKVKNSLFTKTFSISQLIETSDNKLLLAGDTFSREG